MAQLDTKHAFNALSRHATFDSITGLASKEYDSGKIQPGEAILAFQEIRPLFPYFKSMQSVSGTNRFFDHKGTPHIIHGTTGVQQGDPLSMMTYSATTHSIWARVMGRSSSTHGVGFANECFLEDDLPQVLRTIADSIQSFRTDADLEMQPPN